MTWVDSAWRLARSSIDTARRARDVLTDRRLCQAEGSLGRQAAGPVSVRFLGRRSVRDDVESFVGPATWTHETQGGVPLWLRAAPGHLEPDGRADVAMLDALELPLRVPQGAWAWRPQVRAVLPLAPSVDEQLARIRSKGVRHSLEHAASRPWVISLGREDADLDRFYDTLFLPLIAARHGEHARVIARDELRQRWRRGGVLLFLEEAGRPLAGFLAYSSRAEPGTFFYWRNGMTTDAAADHERRAQLFAALERAVIAHAIAHGFARLDLGLAPAVLDDRLFQHKRLLGCGFRRAVGAPRLLLSVRAGAERAVAGALPLLLEHGAEGFGAHVAVDGDGSVASLRLVRTAVRDACFPGVAQVTLHPSRELAAAPSLGPAVDELARELATPLRLAPPPAV